MRFKKFEMNVFSVIALGVGAMVGAGIFALLGQVVIQAESMTYWSFIISGIAAMFCGYSYAKLARFFPNSGGITAYYQAAFPSRMISGLLSLIYLLTLMVSIAMLAKSFAIYALGIFDILGPTEIQINFIALLLVAGLTFLNMQGSGGVGKTEIWLVSIKLIILLALIVAVLFRPDLRYDNQISDPMPISFLGSIGITFFAYAGFGMMVNAAKDVPNPQKDIPRAIYTAIAIVIVLYLSLSYVVLNFIPEAEIKQSADTAVAVVASKMFGLWGKYILSLAALIAFISGINAMFFSSFKIISALSTQKVLPMFLDYKISKSGTIGSLFSAVLIFGAIVYFNFKDVVNIASGTFLLSYLAVLLVNWKLREQTKSSAVVIFSGAILMLFILASFLISLIE